MMSSLSPLLGRKLRPPTVRWALVRPVKLEDTRVVGSCLSSCLNGGLVQQLVSYCKSAESESQTCDSRLSKPVVVRLVRLAFFDLKCTPAHL